MICQDYFGFPIDIGDTVIYPSGYHQDEGKVTKLGEHRVGVVVSISVKNSRGFTKSKNPAACINASLIRSSLPEYFL